MNAPCPFAPFKHAKGNDEHPSFGVSISPEGRSIYRCFTCNLKGDLKFLVWKLDREMATHGRKFPGDVDDLVNWINARNAPDAKEMNARLTQAKAQWESGSVKELGGIKVGPQVVMRNIAGEEKEPDPLPEEDLLALQIPDGLVMKYLTETRGLTPEIIARWELRWHPRARRVAIPIRNVQKKLVGISGRAVEPNAKPKFLHSTGFRRDFYLYGEHLCQTHRAGFLTEGFFDVMKLHQQGYNAFAIMGSYLSPLQMEKCCRFFTEVVILTDGDDAGYESAERISKDLGSRMKVTVAKTPPGQDPDDLDPATLAALLGPPNLIDNPNPTP